MNEIHLQPGQKIAHPDFGEGIVVESIRDGYLRVFFSAGEKQVSESSVTALISRNERIISNVSASPEKLKTNSVLMSIWIKKVGRSHMVRSSSWLNMIIIPLQPSQKNIARSMVFLHRIQHNKENTPKTIKKRNQFLKCFCVWYQLEKIQELKA